MTDRRMDMLADVLVTHCTRVRPGDLVAILGGPDCMSAVEAVYRAALRAGGHPSFHPRSDVLRDVLLRHGSEEQIRHTCPFERHRLACCDVLLVLNAPADGHEAIEPARLAMAQAARAPLLTLSLDRMARGEVRYCCTELPTDAGARRAGMTQRDYADWVYRAGLLHMPDPAGAWARLREQQQRAIDDLAGATTLRFRSLPSTNPATGQQNEGTDLKVDISGGKWQNHAGVSNFPDGEIETGPRSADGVVCFNVPAAYQGHEVRDVRLRFRDGQVVDAGATQGEEFLLAMIDQDPGARRMGEIAMGTNYHITRLTGNPFFDEKAGGTFHLALGAGYPASGNTNRSGLHWDMVCDLRARADTPGGTIEADGEIIQQNGRFVLHGWPGM
ncbi:MAG: aminopeptidase [Leptolyngbya sp. PLA3]|nr:MAG: aminopeptidase [Cyanobacteria bacterium CYA]MCE7968293.1 aminopeptidase [Leptolyngbya sp. PL-A3]